MAFIRHFHAPPDFRLPPPDGNVDRLQKKIGAKTYYDCMVVEKSSDCLQIVART
jgi:hypothetical protein